MLFISVSIFAVLLSLTASVSGAAQLPSLPICRSYSTTTETVLVTKLVCATSTRMTSSVSKTSTTSTTTISSRTSGFSMINSTRRPSSSSTSSRTLTSPRTSTSTRVSTFSASTSRSISRTSVTPRTSPSSSSTSSSTTTSSTTPVISSTSEISTTPVTSSASEISSTAELSTTSGTSTTAQSSSFSQDSSTTGSSSSQEQTTSTSTASSATSTLSPSCIPQDQAVINGDFASGPEPYNIATDGDNILARTLTGPGIGDNDVFQVNILSGTGKAVLSQEVCVMPGEEYVLRYYQGVSVDPDGPNGNSGCSLTAYLDDLPVYTSAICGIGAAPPSNYGTCNIRGQVTAFEEVSTNTLPLTDRVTLRFIFDCAVNDPIILRTNAAFLDAISLTRGLGTW